MISDLSVTAPAGTWVKAGTTVTVTFTATDSGGSLLQTPTASFTSGGAAVTNTPTVTSLGGGSYSASYITHASDTNGAIAYTISASDGAGNTATTGATASGKSLDKSPPVINISSTSYDNTEKELTLVFDPTEDDSGFAFIKFSGIYAADTDTPTYGAPVALPGTHIAAIGLTLAVGDRFYYVVIDGAGNESAVRNIYYKPEEAGPPVVPAGVISRSLASGGLTWRPTTVPRKTAALPATRSAQARRTVPATNWSAWPAAFAVNAPQTSTDKLQDGAAGGTAASPAPAQISGAAGVKTAAAAVPGLRSPETVSSAGRTTAAKASAVKFGPEAPVERPAAQPESAPERASETTMPADDDEMAAERALDARPAPGSSVSAPAGADTADSSVPAPATPEKAPREGPWSRNPAYLQPLGGEKSRREEEEALEA